MSEECVLSSWQTLASLHKVYRELDWGSYYVAAVLVYVALYLTTILKSRQPGLLLALVTVSLCVIGLYGQIDLWLTIANAYCLGQRRAFIEGHNLTGVALIVVPNVALVLVVSIRMVVLTHRAVARLCRLEHSTLCKLQQQSSLADKES